MKTTYMDYSATTYVKPEVLDAMMPFFTEKFGNPSSFYGISRETKMAIDNARAQVAKAINCDPNEVYFTGGGSEADNWAIKGIATAHMKKGNHIITTKIEHHAVLHTCEFLEKFGFEVTYLDVNEEGFVDLKQLEEAITDKTILVSIMFANNEIGTIQPIKEIGEIAKKHNVLFHTDAVQAAGNVPIDVKELKKYKNLFKFLNNTQAIEFIKFVKKNGVEDSIEYGFGDLDTVCNLPHRDDGRKLCKTLRNIRKEFSKLNGIDFEFMDCSNISEICAGTCEVCDYEAEQINRRVKKLKNVKYLEFKVD